MKASGLLWFQVLSRLQRPAAAKEVAVLVLSLLNRTLMYLSLLSWVHCMVLLWGGGGV